MCIACKHEAAAQDMRAHLVQGWEVLLCSLGVHRGGATCHLQHPGGRVVTPPDGGYPLEALQVLNQIAALHTQHAKVGQLHQKCIAGLEMLSVQVLGSLS